MSEQEFDWDKELAAVKAERGGMQKTRLLNYSKLNKYRGEVLKLRKKGASYADIAYWLKTRKACPTSKTTVMRFFKNEQKTP